MPADERPRDTTDQPASGSPPADAPAAEEKKDRSGLTIAAAGIAGAAAVGTGAGAAVAGAGRLLGSESDDEDAEASVAEEEAASLDVFEDLETDSEPPAAGDGAAGRVINTSGPAAPQAARAPDAPGTTYDGLGDDPKRVGPRGDSSTPTASSATADATVIAATETGAAAVGGAPVVMPAPPLINRPAPPQPADPPAPPSASASQSGFEPGPPPEPAAPPIPPASVNPVVASPGESTQPLPEAPASSSSSDSSGIDVMDDVAEAPVQSSSSSSSASTTEQPAQEDITPTGPASVPADDGISSSPDSSSSSSPDGGSTYDPAPNAAPDYGYPPEQQDVPDYGEKAPPYQGEAPADQADPGYGVKPPPYKPKPPVKDDKDYVKDDDYQDVAPPPYYDDDQYEEPVVDDYVDDVVEDPVYDPYYAAFPGNKGYGHPQDLYGDPQPPGPNQAANVYVYRGEQGDDYATIIRNENGNETITWWKGDPPDGHVVYEVYVVHDGYGNYTEQITSYPVGEVDSALGSIFIDGEYRADPDIEYGKNNAEEVIDHQLVTRTWTDEDGNMVIKKMHRDGSGKIEITYGDGVHVVYQQGVYAYYDAEGTLIGGEEYVADQPVDAVDGEDMVADDVDDNEPLEQFHPLDGGPDYFVEEQFKNPFYEGFEPIGAGDNVQYIDPETGANIFVTNLGGGEYQVGWKTDLNSPPGTYDLLIKVQNDGGNYSGYNVTHYTGDVEIESIGPLGYVSVEGDLYQDPWNTYGFPADNASQVVSEDTVVQTWETDDGSITKTYYRDGSFKTVIEYPDGVVITYDPDVNPYPTYETPDGFGDDAEPYEGVEGAYLPPTAPDSFEYNGETYPNPEADDSFTYLKTEGPFGYPGGSMVQHTYVGEDGYTVIISVHSDGQYELMYGDPNTPMAGWDMRLVMQADGSYAPLPQFMVDDPVAEQDAGVGAPGTQYFAADLFGETYGHPADLFPNGPAGTFTENGRQVDYYPDGTRVEHYDDEQRITWYDAQGNVMLGASVLSGDETRLDVLPWPYVLEHYAPTLEPFITSHGAYPDPASTDMTYQQEVGYGYIKHTYEDGTEKTYLTSAQDPGWIQINYPDGTVAVWNGSSVDNVLEGSGEYAQEAGEADDDPLFPEGPTDVQDGGGDEPWQMGGPEQFLVSGNAYFDNPEHDNDYQLINVSADGNTHFYQDSNGYQAVIQNMGGHYTVFYGQNPPVDIDVVINVYDDGSIAVPYYPEGGIGVEEEETTEAPQEDIFEPWTAHLPGLFPVNGVNYVNPEAYLGGNNSFSLISETETQRVYESNGHLVRITEQPGGMYSFEWGSELGNPDVAMDVYADGTYSLLYNAFEEPEQPVETQSASSEDVTITGGIEAIDFEEIGSEVGKSINEGIANAGNAVDNLLGIQQAQTAADASERPAPDDALQAEPELLQPLDLQAPEGLSIVDVDQEESSTDDDDDSDGDDIP